MMFVTMVHVFQELPKIAMMVMSVPMIVAITILVLVYTPTTMLLAQTIMLVH